MIEIDSDVCVGCRLCIKYCPRDALPDKVEERCNKCRLCELICPHNAITVID